MFVHCVFFQWTHLLMNESIFYPNTQQLIIFLLNRFKTWVFSTSAGHSKSVSFIQFVCKWIKLCFFFVLIHWKRHGFKINNADFFLWLFWSHQYITYNVSCTAPRQRLTFFECPLNVTCINTVQEQLTDWRVSKLINFKVQWVQSIPRHTVSPFTSFIGYLLRPTSSVYVGTHDRPLMKCTVYVSLLSEADCEYNGWWFEFLLPRRVNARVG